LDATNAYSLFIEDAETVAGIPVDVLQTAKELAAADSRTGWKFTLHMPSYLPVLQYADNRNFREQMYRAYATRASELDCQTGSGKDNMPLINKILELRKEAAQMLGYENYAEVSLATKMATSRSRLWIS
jgi:oligopeptidase A